MNQRRNFLENEMDEPDKTGYWWAKHKSCINEEIVEVSGGCVVRVGIGKLYEYADSEWLQYIPLYTPISEWTVEEILIREG